MARKVARKLDRQRNPEISEPEIFDGPILPRANVRAGLPELQEELAEKQRHLGEQEWLGNLFTGSTKNEEFRWPTPSLLELIRSVRTGSVKRTRKGTKETKFIDRDPDLASNAEWMSLVIAYLRGAGTDALEQKLNSWEADWEHILKSRLHCLSKKDRKGRIRFVNQYGDEIPIWAIEREPKQTLEVLRYRYPDLQSNGEQTKNAALTMETVKVRWWGQISQADLGTNESIRKRLQRFRDSGDRFWESSERGRNIREQHFINELRRAYGEITERPTSSGGTALYHDEQLLFDNPAVIAFFSFLGLDDYIYQDDFFDNKKLFPNASLIGLYSHYPPSL